MSLNRDWDTPPDVIYIDKKGFHGLPRYHIVPARIEIPPDIDFKDWSTYKTMAALSENLVKKIEQLVLDDGANSKDRYYSSKSISANQWVKIE